MSEHPVLRVTDLAIRFPGDAPEGPTVSRVSFDIEPGGVLALVGQSGSGKSLTAAALSGLLPRGASVAGGTAHFTGRDGERVDLLALNDRQLDRIRGAGIGMIFQNPLNSLDPSFTIANQLGEVIRRHRPAATRAERYELAVGWLRRVGFGDPDRTLASYPHELSGGMRQRVMIALAGLAEPTLLIADEPTTALDTVVQRQVLDILRDAARAAGAALLFITHDFDVVEYLADSVVVLEKGVVVESGPRAQVLGDPRHPYTRELLAAVPRLGRRAELPDWDGVRRLGAGVSERKPRLNKAAVGPLGHAGGATKPGNLLEIRGVGKEFTIGGWGTGRGARRLQALRDVTLDVRGGEIYGLIGASGSGKSTLARVIGGLLPASAGTVRFDGVEVTTADRKELRALRTRLQYVFQDPAGSLNPGLRVGAQIARPLRRYGRVTSARDARRAVGAALELVGLPATFADRYPHSLSGGQQQRVGIARALVLEPDLLILDEPTSSLDVSAQAGIVDLLLELRAELALTCVFIGHNLALVEWMCDRIGVLDGGALVDEFPTGELRSGERARATRVLLEANLGAGNEVMV